VVLFHGMPRVQRFILMFQEKILDQLQLLLKFVCILPYTIGAPVLYLNQGVLKQNQRENAFQNIFKFYIIAF
jgi:hypothetical protein